MTTCATQVKVSSLAGERHGKGRLRLKGTALEHPDRVCPAGPPQPLGGCLRIPVARTSPRCRTDRFACRSRRDGQSSKTGKAVWAPWTSPRSMVSLDRRCGASRVAPSAWHRVKAQPSKRRQSPSTHLLLDHIAQQRPRQHRASERSSRFQMATELPAVPNEPSAVATSARIPAIGG